MKWRRSGKRPKWFKGIRRIEEAENKRAYRIFKAEHLKYRGRLHPYRYGGLKILKEAGWREPAPLVDVFQERDGVLVVAEIKGFNRENIKTHIEGHRLVLSARTQGRQYYRSLNLPVAVIPETMRITYKNGVLEIRLRKALEEKAVNKMAG